MLSIKSHTNTDGSVVTHLKDWAELGGKAITWATLLPGCLIFFIYTVKLGDFPTGLGVGEGLAFYLICTAFWIAFIVYAVAATVLGSVAIAPLAQWAQKRRHAQQAKHPNVDRSGSLVELPTVDYRPMRDPLVLGAAIVVFLLLLVYGYKDIWNALQFFLMALCQGLLVCIAWNNSSLIRWLAVRSSHGMKTEAEATVETLRAKRTRRLSLGALLITPLLAGPPDFSLVDSAFRATQLRKDNATIHIKKPWANRIASSGLRPQASFLGDEYAEFQKVNVLLRSVGTKVVLELPGADGKRPAKLSIPADVVHVE